MQYSEGNIFHIADPQTYICTVWSYRASHSTLLVRADKNKFGNETLYLSFTGVLYFEGPLKWMGAEFNNGAVDECIKLLHRQGLKSIPDNELLDRFGLFVVELPNSEFVKILASKRIEKTSNIPPDFPWLIEPSPS